MSGSSPKLFSKKVKWLFIFPQSTFYQIHQYPVENILKLLPRILQFPESLGKNLDKILTKSAKNMYDLARSCQEVQEKCLIFLTEKTHKRVFSTKNLSGKTKNLVKKSKKCQECCQEIQENPRNTKNLAKNSGNIQ